MGSGHAIALKSGTGDTVYNGNVADAKMPDSAMTTRIGDMMELSGVTDIDQSRRDWAREQGIFVYEDYAAMLSDAVSYTHLDVYKRQDLLCAQPVM